MAETDLTFKSVNELSALITSKEVSVTEVTKAFLERIERLQPRLNAYITICREEALTSARAMDESLVVETR